MFWKAQPVCTDRSKSRTRSRRTLERCLLSWPCRSATTRGEVLVRMCDLRSREAFAGKSSNASTSPFASLLACQSVELFDHEAVCPVRPGKFTQLRSWSCSSLPTIRTFCP